MPLINFQKQFAEAVKSGIKRQTIRKQRKNPIKEGDTLYLYTGLRTKNALKLKEVKCAKVIPIEIHSTQYMINNEPVPGYWEILHDFAVADGFNNWQELVKWFGKTYGLPFKGVLISW